ncbi:MAG: VWA domain-containing protein [bacterium]
MAKSERRQISHQKDVLENLAEFCRLLRSEGIGVELSSLLAAAEGLHWVDWTDPESLRYTLGATLTHIREELFKFQDLFELFWLKRLLAPGKGAPQAGQDGGVEDLIAQGQTPKPSPDQEAAEQRRTSLRYSPHSLQRLPEPAMGGFQIGSSSVQALRRFLRTLVSRPSRRWEACTMGSRFSFRRTLRKSLQYGGDLIYLQLVAQRAKRPRILLLCDVSGSMEENFRLILEFAASLVRMERSAEVFLFSTDIARVTLQLRSMQPEGFVSQLPQLMPQWGAGTRIGHCLRSLRQKMGARLLTQRPVLAIYSDGWDQGEIELLRREMESLKRKCKSIIWLNPLVGSPGYEPTCQGMAAALPFVDLFLPLRQVEDLLRLGKEVRKLVK